MTAIIDANPAGHACGHQPVHPPAHGLSTVAMDHHNPRTGSPRPAAAPLLAAVALLAGFVAATSASDLPGTPDDYVMRMDLDGDNRVSLVEFRDYMSRGFRSRDLDGNGILQGAELPDPGARPLRLADHLERLAEAFARQDRNGDGWLDAAELAAPPR